MARKNPRKSGDSLEYLVDVYLGPGRFDEGFNIKQFVSISFWCINKCGTDFLKSNLACLCVKCV